MQHSDTKAGYGWISIVLHWLTAIVIFALLFSGSSIAVDDPSQRATALNAHTSIGIASYLLLWLRIAWRAVVGHPGPNERQRGQFFDFGKWMHSALLVVLAMMLVSGPAMAWASGRDIVVFDWFRIPAANMPQYLLRDAFHFVHRSCAIAMLAGIVLHLCGVYKHMAFNRDGTLGRIFFPAKNN